MKPGPHRHTLRRPGTRLMRLARPVLQREAQAARNLEFENNLKEAGMKFNDINRDVLRAATESVRLRLATKVPGGQDHVTSILKAK